MPFASDSELSECLSKDLPIVASGNTTIPCCNILQLQSTNSPTVLYKLSTAGPRVKCDFAKRGCTEVLGHLMTPQCVLPGAHPNQLKSQ
jgi:hypothetical protein